MTIDEQLEIMQAFKDEKAIQYKYRNKVDDWDDLRNVAHEFNFFDLEYRIVEPEKTLDEYIEELDSMWEYSSDINFLKKLFEILENRYQRKED